ncbi:UNVERIFIED_CONTAM: hypothetical protein FKN15_036906 [Acipenser sinensis]
MDRNALAELLQALESRRDAEERRREERYTALIERAFDRGEVETVEEWIHLKAIPSPQVDQETCLTCLKGEEWCFAVSKVRHKPPDQPPPWQEVELLVPKKGRRGGAKKAKKQAPAPEWEQPERPQPKRGESVHPQPRRGRGKPWLWGIWAHVGHVPHTIRRGGARASNAQKGGAQASSAQKGGARASSAQKGGKKKRI